MKFGSNLILVLASLVLFAGILLQVNAFPGAFLPIVLGVLGLIVGSLLKFFGKRNAEKERK